VNPIEKDAVGPELRKAERFPCPDRPEILVAVKPEFRTCKVAVFDISQSGIGILCEKPFPVGSQLAILWQYGNKATHRTVLARIVHAARQGQWLWRAGCVFDGPLTLDELRAFFLASLEPVQDEE